MDYNNWLTVCVSSQVGCPLGCSFCATGKMGFIRNLTQSEIVDQIVFWQQQLYPRYVGRVVLMGMGEPLLNWDQVVSALEIINSPQCLNIGSRKISLSTAGIIPGIKDLIKTHPQINLAISLHSANQSKRSQIMPIARQYSLEDLSQTCRFYTRQTGRQLFFEYALIKDFNDSESDINGLAKLIKTDPLFFLNLIPLNPVPGGLPPSPTSTIRRIESQLNQLRVPYSLRRTFGQNIAAACGQLATPK
jgi:23S rRNA (adenine2503-C2)-methyltransferase